MKRKWKRELGEVFWAPPAKRKEEFFQSLELPGISFWEFLIKILGINILHSIYTIFFQLCQVDFKNFLIDFLYFLC